MRRNEDDRMNTKCARWDLRLQKLLRVRVRSSRKECERTIRAHALLYSTPTYAVISAFTSHILYTYLCCDISLHISHIQHNKAYPAEATVFVRSRNLKWEIKFLHTLTKRDTETTGKREGMRARMCTVSSCHLIICNYSRHI